MVAGAPGGSEPSAIPRDGRAGPHRSLRPSQHAERPRCGGDRAGRCARVWPRTDRLRRPSGAHHLALVPVAQLDLPSLRALAYAASLRQPVLAVHISPEKEDAERFHGYWDAWGDHLPLELIVSPYRAIVPPMVHCVEELHEQRPDLTLTIVLPELVVCHPWHRPLHNRVALRLRRALRNRPGVVVTTVPFHLPCRGR